MQNFAQDISKKDGFILENNFDFREDINLMSGFDQIGIADQETGMAIFDDGIRLDVSDREYYKNAIHGNSSIDFFQGEGDETGHLFFSMPIYHENEIIGVLFARANHEWMNKYFRTDIFDGYGFLCVTDNQGDMIGFGNQKNLVEDQNNILEYFSTKKISTDEIVENMGSGLTHSFAFINDEEEWCTTYLPLAINDWYLFCSVPNEALAPTDGTYELLEKNHIIKVLLVYSAACILISLLIWHERAKIKKENVRLKKAEEFAGMASFEGDYKKDTFVLNENYFKLFGRNPVYKKISDFTTPPPDILEEDHEVFLKMGRDLIAGKDSGSVQYRLFSKDGNIQWHQFVFHVCYDKHGLPLKCYGMIVPIDRHLKLISKLQMQVEKDPMTGVLNRTAFELYVNLCFSGDSAEQNHALLLLDLDNFKQINDGYGHILGDHALVKTADILKVCVRSSDYVGRLGGDEFAVFLQNANKEQAAKKAGEICQALENAEMKSNEAVVTCSIGIACFPEDGSDFNELYGLADRGLYRVKESGKNSFSMVNDND
ncbi:MAG: sensor domain-containing diguanylate cyclase [Anaerotignum sp.]|nr:sensor domain-containing diguanylate cyclase [Anaerotignum sp.]